MFNDDLFNRFDTIPECHGQTDGIAISIPRAHSWMMWCVNVD